MHAVTKLTPFELMFGRKSNIPLDLVYGQLHDTEEILRQYEVEWDYTEYSLKLKEDLSSMYEYAVVLKCAIGTQKCKSRHLSTTET